MPPQKPEEGDGVWRWNKDSFESKKDLIVFKKSTRSPLINSDGTQAQWNLYTKTYLNDKLIDGNIPRDLFEGFLNRNGSETLKKLKIPFDFPKPVELVSYIAKIIRARGDDIILDFFSGSSTTAHAVMALNFQFQYQLRFIMVQIPEPCDFKSEAYKEGYKTIADIGKERIRRAGRLLKSESATSAPNIDVGFRVLKVDSSNLKDVYYRPDAVGQGDLLSQKDNIREDRTPEDLLFHVMLDWGVDLGLPTISEVIAGKKVFFVDGNALAACFDTDISEELVTALAKRRLHDLPLLKVVFRDAGYASDSAKINVEQIFKLLSPTTELRTL
jgi:adenine-specific DNA-methyltransferase